ncbi:hypothetical protein BGZ94_004029 [Podila epigama]|nr:hypothetical protein BGZ94_004029 [Podila epigama]
MHAQNHGSNPWLMQGHQPNSIGSLDEFPHNTPLSNNFGFDGSSNDFEPYIGSKARIAQHFVDKDNENKLDKVYQDSRVRTWSHGDTPSHSEHSDDDHCSDHSYIGGPIHEVMVSSDITIVQGGEDPLSKAMLLRSDMVYDDSEHGDLLENLVQRLQSEVADTRVIVQDLENRLSEAENSNRHIVQELKVLLADAEGTLVGSDDSDNESSAWVTTKEGLAGDEDSNVVYNQKQQEQYDRYRRSCDMVSLELQLLLENPEFDSYESDGSTWDGGGTREKYQGSTDATSPTVSSSTSITLPSYLSPSQYRKLLDSGSLGDSKVERIYPHFQTPLSRPNVQRRQQRHDRLYDSLYRQSRHYKNQGVGANRSKSIWMQLYDLWKQTWLRKRFMHVLTGSVEALVILLILVKVSQASLSWIGFPLDNGQNVLTYIFNRKGSLDSKGDAASVAAREIYDKVRRDGLRFRRIQFRQSHPKTEALVHESTLGGVERGKMLTPFTPAGMVFQPMKRMLARTIAGLMLAYICENLRYVTMKL